jgi:hypothetical protein
MNRFAKTFTLGLICLSMAGAGLATDAQTEAPAATPAQKELKFIDIAKFDRDLGGELSSGQPGVRVSFYTRTSPNDIPERLQRWIKAVEDSGGKINITPPPDELTPKSPMLLVGLLGSLWSSLKALNEISDERVLRAAQSHNVDFKLQRSPDGSIYIAEVEFTRKP